VIEKIIFPEDPADRLDFVLDKAFGNSPTALAIAAGVSRAAVNKWPPAAGWLLDEHLSRAIDFEIAAAKQRLELLGSMKMALNHRRWKHREESEIEIRKARRDAEERDRE
jgi:hypothetical protein